MTANTSGSPWQSGHEFHTPQDDTTLIGLRASFEIKGGPVGVAVSVNGELAPDSRRNAIGNPIFDAPRWLEPGATLKIFMEGYAPLSKWIESAQSPDGVKDVHYFEANVGYSDGFDTGITDGVRIRLPARGIHEDPNRRGIWVFQPDLIMHGAEVHCTAVEIGNRTRVYWQSKNESVPVADPAGSASQ